MLITKQQIHQYLPCGKSNVMVIFPYKGIRKIKRRDLTIVDRVVDINTTFIHSGYLVEPSVGSITHISDTKFMELSRDYEYTVTIGRKSFKKILPCGSKLILKDKGCTDMLPQIGVIDPI